MKYAKPEWRDGQPYSSEFDDVYFSISGGIEETEHVFIQHNQLCERFQQLTDDNFVIAETGFGSGLNFLVCVNHWLRLTDATKTLHFYSIENTPFTPDDLARAQAAWPAFSEIAEELQQQYQVASVGFHRFDLFNGRVRLTLMIGDVLEMLQQAQINVDAWMLDGFAPGRNAQMWSSGVFAQLARLSKPGATFGTYTAAGSVRRGLIDAGFEVSKVAGIGAKRDMLSGCFTGCFNGDTQSRVDQSRVDNEAPWFAHKSQHSRVKRASIIGAGIAGLTTAWSLVKRGYQVEVIDMGEQPGAQASGNPQGMIMPRLSLQDSADAEFYLAAYFYSLRCLQQLDAEQHCWKQTGGIQLPSTPRIRKQIEQYPSDKAIAEVLSAESASELSGISIDQAVHYFPLAACVYPEKLLARLIDAMGDALALRLNSAVDSIEYTAGQWQLKSADARLITETDCLVIASAWQSKQFDQLDHLHLNPARGQISLLKASPASSKLMLPISYEGYMMPAVDGLHVAGASFEMDDCDRSLRLQEHQANIREANHWLGTGFSEDDLLDGRASVRAVTPDRIPAVGPAPRESDYRQRYGELYKGKPAHTYSAAEYWPGLYVNSGHGARGFSSSFLCAELLAASICDEALPVSNRVRYALHPARFLIRSLKKKRQ